LSVVEPRNLASVSSPTPKSATVLLSRSAATKNLASAGEKQRAHGRSSAGPQAPTAHVRSYYYRPTDIVPQLPHFRPLGAFIRRDSSPFRGPGDPHLRLYLMARIGRREVPVTTIGHRDPRPKLPRAGPLPRSWRPGFTRG